MANYIVTGSTGYIGSSLVKSLAACGNSILCIIRKGSDLTLLAQVRERVEFCVYDGTLESLSQVISDFHATAVVHVASHFIAEHKPEDITSLINSNVLFGAHLLEAMSGCGVTKLINIGTSWQHYMNREYDPVCFYAATKQAFVDLIKYYVSARQFSCITLKLFDTYGTGDPRKKLVHLLGRVASTGEELLMSPGGQKLDLVHVDDVVSAIFVALEKLGQLKQGSYQEFGVSTRKPMTLKEVVSRYEKHFNKKLNIVWGGRSYLDREVMELWSNFRTLDDWSARHVFPEGLE